MAATKLELSGSLCLENNNTITLADLEELCSEARKLGLKDSTVLRATRQGAAGSIVAWSFAIPVAPLRYDDPQPH